ncbi:MAG: thiamine diphosphokinase [Oscillospiraceae bacterium]|nr:thiamine diphosphokinase [Oscillospiraceae bacterium]
MQTCYLVGASPDAVRIDPQPDDFVIAVDDGINYLKEWGVAPNMIVGDPRKAENDLPPGVLFIKSPPNKQGTDMALAFAEGYHRGMRYFVITGAGGGREDYSLANLQLMVRAAELGAFAVAQGNSHCVTTLTDKGELRLCGSGTVSIFAYGGEATGVTVRGMRRSMEGETLRCDTPRGINNYLDGGEGFITMESGVLVVHWETSKINVMKHFVNI